MRLFYPAIAVAALTFNCLPATVLLLASRGLPYTQSAFIAYIAFLGFFIGLAGASRSLAIYYAQRMPTYALRGRKRTIGLRAMRDLSRARASRRTIVQAFDAIAYACICGAVLSCMLLAHASLYI